MLQLLTSISFIAEKLKLIKANKLKLKMSITYIFVKIKSYFVLIQNRVTVN